MAGDIEELIKKLKGKDADERREAANALGDAAQEGKDISAASDALNDALSDENHVVRVRAAWALAAYHLQKKDIASVGRLIAKKDEGIIFGAIQALPYAMRKGLNIGALVPVLEKLLNKAEDNMLKGSLVDTLVDHYMMVGAHDSAARLLKHRDMKVRYGAASAYRNAAMDGIDISPSIPALSETLRDRDDSVKRAAAEALGYYHAKRKGWKEIDRLLAEKDSNVRGPIVSLLYSHATEFDIRSDIPNLMRILEEDETDLKDGAISILREAAEGGVDISFAVPMLRRLEMNPRLKEEAGLALKTYELRKDAGKRCQSCLDCELGRRPGDESKSLEHLASIVKEIACCGGEVTHNIFRCKKCGKHYASSYYDHTGFEEEQFFIKEISKKDAEKAVKEMKKCKDPEDEDCDCAVHKKYLKDDDLPVKGVLKFSETLD